MATQTLEGSVKNYVSMMEGWSTPEKCWHLAKTIIDTNAKLTVELGVFGGRGLIAMAMAHRHQNYGIAWGFDPWLWEACVEGKNAPENDEWWKKVDLKSIYKGFVNHVLMHALEEYCYWARLKSQNAVKLFDDDSIDIIHQDSNHSEEISCDEVNRWKNKVKVGGLWFQDDIDWPTTKKAQELIIKSGYERVFTNDKWAVYKRTK
jgi:hypothetical protein